MNARNWRACVKDGVTVSKPVYAAQIAIYQAYMEASVPGISARPGTVHGDQQGHGRAAPRAGALRCRSGAAHVRPRRADPASHRRGRVCCRASPQDRDFFECRFCAHAERCWGLAHERRPTDQSDFEAGPSHARRHAARWPEENIIHFNPWRDFNDAAPPIDVFGDEPDPEQIAHFIEVVFGYCDGLIPVRSFIDKGQGIDGRPHNIWIDADQRRAREDGDLRHMGLARGRCGLRDPRHRRRTRAGQGRRDPADADRGRRSRHRRHRGQARPSGAPSRRTYHGGRERRRDVRGPAQVPMSGGR